MKRDLDLNFSPEKYDYFIFWFLYKISIQASSENFHHIKVILCKVNILCGITLILSKIKGGQIAIHYVSDFEIIF